MNAKNSSECNIIMVNASEGKWKAAVQQQTVPSEQCEVNLWPDIFVDNELFVLMATVLSSNERKS